MEYVVITVHQARRSGSIGTCEPLWQNRRQMGVAEGVHSGSARHHLGKPAVRTQRQPLVTTVPLPLHMLMNICS